MALKKTENVTAKKTAAKKTGASTRRAATKKNETSKNETAASSSVKKTVRKTSTACKKRRPSKKKSMRLIPLIAGAAIGGIFMFVVMAFVIPGVHEIAETFAAGKEARADVASGSKSVSADTNAAMVEGASAGKSDWASDSVSASEKSSAGTNASVSEAANANKSASKKSSAGINASASEAQSATANKSAGIKQSSIANNTQTTTQSQNAIQTQRANQSASANVSASKNSSGTGALANANLMPGKSAPVGDSASKNSSAGKKSSIFANASASKTSSYSEKNSASTSALPNVPANASTSAVASAMIDRVPSPNIVPSPNVQQNEKNPVQPVQSPLAATIPQAVRGAKLVFVFDDAGHNMSQLENFVTLPFPISVAVLPQLSHSAEAAARIRKSGNEVMLHQPMQAINAKVNPGAGAILPQMSNDEVMATVKANIAEIAPIAGINNHEGSLISEDEFKMMAVLEVAKESGAFYLDSRTTSQTRVPQAAMELGMGYYARNIFLDNTKKREDILNEIRKGLYVANKNGTAIMIGHIWSSDVLPAILRELYPILTNKGYTFSTVGKSGAMIWQ